MKRLIPLVQSRLRALSPHHFILFLLISVAGHNLYLGRRLEQVAKDAKKAAYASSDASDFAHTAIMEASEASHYASEALEMATEARDYAADASDNAYFKHCRYCASGDYDD